jgi:cellulose synthase operon protein C
MANVRSIRSTILAFVILLSLSQSGCSVFSAVGGWFSQSYDNTIAYFNAYYNAKRLFDDAEAEVLTARSAMKTKSATPSNQPAATGSTAKQKFTAVIDKCSNVLSFYPKSTVVDDALFLIGKSYFYQDEFVKAERKFTELVAKNPKRILALQGQLWLLKTLEKLNKFEEANRVGQDLAPSAIEAGEENIAGEALMILGDIAVTQKNTETAIDAYTKAVAAAGDGAMRAAAQVKIGDLYFSLPDYEKAAAAYMEVQKFSPDDYMLYDSEVQAAIAYRRSKQYDQSVAVLRKMDADYRFLDYRGTIRYEIGRSLEKGGKLDEAVDMYRLVDTTYSKTEAGARAAYDLGRLYQFDLGKYADARIAYSHATVGSTPEVTRDATKKVTAFDNYFRLQQQFFKQDSILSILDVDSLWLRKDSVKVQMKTDTLTAPDLKELPSGSTRRSRSLASGMRDSVTISTKDTLVPAGKHDSSAVTKKESPALLRDTLATPAKDATVPPSRQDSSAVAKKENPAALRDTLKTPANDARAFPSGRDSLGVAKQTSPGLRKPDSTLAVASRDTLLSKRDTLKTPGLRDTTASKYLGDSKYLPRPKRSALIDSLGNLSYQLGELFYTELEVPDSTFFWLNQSIKIGIDSVKTPRALYVLSEVARADSSKSYGDEKDLYKMLMQKYPQSTYAEEARIALGFRPTVKIADPAEAVYAAAESLMVAGKYEDALDSLGRVVSDYEKSPLVPKSRYTMAWIYEHYLAKPDSALAQYTTLAQKFGTTRYGLAAQRRIPPPEVPTKPATDSSKKSLPDSLKAKGNAARKPSSDSSTTKLVPPVPRVLKDSTDEAPKIRQQVPDSLRARLEPDLMEKKPPSADSLRRQRKKEEE